MVTEIPQRHVVNHLSSIPYRQLVWRHSQQQGSGKNIAHSRDKRNLISGRHTLAIIPRNFEIRQRFTQTPSKLVDTLIKFRSVPSRP